MNLSAILDTLLEHSSDYKYDKKTREKAKKVYAMAITYENMFLTFVLSDILSLCSKICKILQEDNLYLPYCLAIFTNSPSKIFRILL